MGYNGSMKIIKEKTVIIFSSNSSIFLGTWALTYVLFPMGTHISLYMIYTFTSAFLPVSSSYHLAGDKQQDHGKLQICLQEDSRGGLET